MFYQLQTTKHRYSVCMANSLRIALVIKTNQHSTSNNNLLHTHTLTPFRWLSKSSITNMNICTVNNYLCVTIAGITNASHIQRKIKMNELEKSPIIFHQVVGIIFAAMLNHCFSYSWHFRISFAHTGNKVSVTVLLRSLLIGNT